MLRLAGYAVDVDAPRLLNSRGLARALAAARLPSYSWLRVWLEDYELRARVVGLWGDLFGGVPEELRHYGAFDLEIEFVGRVHHDLFPVDLSFMDSIYNGGDNPLDLGIMIEGRGIPWEMLPMDQLHEVQALTLAVAWQSGRMDTVDVFDDDVAAYWLGLDREPPAWEVSGLDEFRRQLMALPEPLDGLADVLAALCKTTGNAFLDTVDAFWQVEYDDFSFYRYCWCPTCIKHLADEYGRVRDAFARLDALAEWWDQGELPARERVLAALADAAAGRIPRTEEAHDTTH